MDQSEAQKNLHFRCKFILIQGGPVGRTYLRTWQRLVVGWVFLLTWRRRRVHVAMDGVTPAASAWPSWMEFWGLRWVLKVFSRRSEILGLVWGLWMCLLHQRLPAWICQCSSRWFRRGKFQFWRLLCELLCWFSYFFSFWNCQASLFLMFWFAENERPV